VLRPDDDANRDVYGAGASPRTILASREISAPPEARELLTALASVSGTTTTEPAAPSGAPAANTRSPQARGSESPAATPAPQAPSNDRDLRARIAEMQQTLDRLLTSTGNSTVGTTGTTNDTGEMVTIDRAMLVRLREQLQALAAALEKR